MSSKRSFQQRDEEPWLRYPDSSTGKDFSRSRSSSTSQRLQFLDFGRQELDTLSLRSETNSNHKRTISKVNGPSSPYHQHHRHIPEEDNSLKRLSLTHQDRSSFISRRGPAPRTLSEELSMAMQTGPEDDCPSPITPSGLLPSPADMSTPSTSSSPSSTSSSDHFPLFKSSLTSQQSSNGSGGQKQGPSPLSLPNSFHPHTQGENAPEMKSPSFPFQLGSPPSLVSNDSTTAMDTSSSPHASASNLTSSSFRYSHHQSRGPMSSAASTTSSYYSLASNHTNKTNYHHHHSSCLHGNSHQQHRPSCHHYTNPQQPEIPTLYHGPKPGRATKGIHRFGFPHFRPQMDDSFMETNTKTASTSTSGSGGYGIQRRRDYDNNEEEDEDENNVDGMGYSSEPPKKRLRSTASILIGAAVETVIFTGAVALSAYQLLTGKGKQNDSHSKHSSLGSEDDDIIDDTKTQDEDPMEEKLTLRSDTPTSEPDITRKVRPVSGSFGRTRVPGYHKAKTPRSFRSRHSYSGSGSLQSGHTRSSSMPVRPNTGTEDSDEAFLRMEAQLNSLIAEGKRALNSRIEVWDEE